MTENIMHGVFKFFHLEACVVEVISLATLYGSQFEAGLRSSIYPFQLLSAIAFGIRIDAPRSPTPQLKVSIR